MTYERYRGHKLAKNMFARLVAKASNQQKHHLPWQAKMGFLNRCAKHLAVLRFRVEVAIKGHAYIAHKRAAFGCYAH
jgi:hypothetical protein